jgi:hypothetical protein
MNVLQSLLGIMGICVAGLLIGWVSGLLADRAGRLRPSVVAFLLLAGLISVAVILLVWTLSVLVKWL